MDKSEKKSKVMDGMGGRECERQRDGEENEDEYGVWVINVPLWLS